MSRSQDKQTWWKHRATEAERKLAEIHPVVEWLPEQYVNAVSAALHQHYNGVTGDEIRVNTGGAQSRPPKHDPAAGKLLSTERRDLEDRAERLLRNLDPRPDEFDSGVRRAG